MGLGEAQAADKPMAVPGEAVEKAGGVLRCTR
jgi:hypothetical protein